MPDIQRMDDDVRSSRNWRNIYADNAKIGEKRQQSPAQITRNSSDQNGGARVVQCGTSAYMEDAHRKPFGAQRAEVLQKSDRSTFSLSATKSSTALGIHVLPR
jgi:hypothetical protein